MDFQGMSDRALLVEIGGRVQRTRLNRNVTQPELAQRAGVSRRALQNLEAGASTTLSTFIRVLRALGVLDQVDAFLPVPGYSPVQLAKLKGKERQRATGRRTRHKQEGG
jgi:transcriptional regulator with XRE-family HTH domain